MPSPQVIYLVRHAKAQAMGTAEDHKRELTPTGQGEAKRIGKALRHSDPPISAIYSSPYTRCVQTAQPIANKLGLSIQIEPRLGKSAKPDDTLGFVRSLRGVVLLVTHHEQIPPLAQGLTGQQVQSDPPGNVVKIVDGRMDWQSGPDQLKDRRMSKKTTEPLQFAGGGGGHWVTIGEGEEEGHRVHVFISGGGTITKGPKSLVGGNVGHLGDHKMTHHPEGHEPKGAKSHPSYHEHQAPEKKPGKPFARERGAPQTRQEQGPEPLSEAQTKAGLAQARAEVKPKGRGDSDQEALESEQRHLAGLQAQLKGATGKQRVEIAERVSRSQQQVSAWQKQLGHASDTPTTQPKPEAKLAAAPTDEAIDHDAVDDFMSGHEKASPEKHQEMRDKIGGLVKAGKPAMGVNLATLKEMQRKLQATPAPTLKPTAEGEGGPKSEIDSLVAQAPPERTNPTQEDIDAYAQHMDKVKAHITALDSKRREADAGLAKHQDRMGELAGKAAVKRMQRGQSATLGDGRDSHSSRPENRAKAEAFRKDIASHEADIEKLEQHRNKMQSTHGVEHQAYTKAAQDRYARIEAQMQKEQAAKKPAPAKAAPDYHEGLKNATAEEIAAHPRYAEAAADIAAQAEKIHGTPEKGRANFMKFQNQQVMGAVHGPEHRNDKPSPEDAAFIKQVTAATPVYEQHSTAAQQYKRIEEAVKSVAHKHGLDRGQDSWLHQHVMGLLTSHHASRYVAQQEALAREHGHTLDMEHGVNMVMPRLKARVEAEKARQRVEHPEQAKAEDDRISAMLRRTSEEVSDDAMISQIHLFRDFDTEERKKMRARDFGGPHKSFPIKSAKDLSNAASLLHDAKNPGKVKRRLIAIAKRKGLALPASWGDSAPRQADEPTSTDVHTNSAEWDGAAKRKRKPNRMMRQMVKNMRAHITQHGYCDADAFEKHIKSARGHAGGMAKAERRKEAMQAAESKDAPIGGGILYETWLFGERPDDWKSCKACKKGKTEDCTCPGCKAGKECWCCKDKHMQHMEHAMGNGHVYSESGEGFRLFLPVSFAEAPDWIPYLPKPGTFSHPRYGNLSITTERNQEFVQNFNTGVYQKQIPLDAEHQTKLSGAMGWVQELKLNTDGSADARVEWTDRGRTMLSDNRFKYVSPEWYDSWADPAGNVVYKNVVIGGALTTRPYFKESSLRPLVATEASDYWTTVPGEPTISYFTQESTMSKTTDTQQSLTFEERLAAVELERDEAKRMAEEVAEQARQATERVAMLEADKRRQSFAEIVVKGNWFGPVNEHVQFMESLSDEQREFYVQHNRALAEQLKDNVLLRSVGRTGGTDDASPAGRVEALAKAKQAQEPKLSREQAISQVYAENPRLYEEENAAR